MAVETSLDDQQVARLRQLRAAGSSPKNIARTLGVRPAAVAPWIRVVAREDVAARSEPPVVGCWVNPGWSGHLTVHGHDDWPDSPSADVSTSGLVGVLVARRGRPHRVSVCCYLVDVYCLGVKDVLGPRIMSEDDLPAFRRWFFGVFGCGEAPIEASLELARHLVWGAIDYARGLGQRSPGVLDEVEREPAVLPQVGHVPQKGDLDPALGGAPARRTPGLEH